MTEPIYDTDLKPCPFCGSPAHIVWGAKRRVYGSQETVEGACVYCETCNAEMFSTSKHLIAEMWNRRADDDKLHEYDKALKTMGDLNDGQSEKIAKLKAQLRAQEQTIAELQEALDLANADLINQGIHKTYDRDVGRQTLQAITQAPIKDLQLIADMAKDYNDCNTVESLKSLIDEMREIAMQGMGDVDD